MNSSGLRHASVPDGNFPTVIMLLRTSAYFRKSALVTALVLVICLGGMSVFAQAPGVTKGEKLYLPIYSHLIYGNVAARGKPSQYPLSVLVSLRNSDPHQAIRIQSARYHDSSGKLLREYISTPKVLSPLASQELFVERDDLRGGAGASFLIVWQSDKPVNPPIVEALHADITGNRTLSFITTSRPIR